MRSGWARRLTIGLVAATAVLDLAAVAMWLHHRGVAIIDLPAPPPTGPFLAGQILVSLPWCAAAVVLLRRPSIGWSVLAAAAAAGHAAGAAGYGLAVDRYILHGSLPGGGLGLWLIEWALPIEVLTLTWMLSTVPDGKLPERGWLRSLAIASIGLDVAGLILAALTSFTIDGGSFDGATHPFGGLAIPDWLSDACILPTALTAIIIVVTRWRRSVGAERDVMAPLVVITLVTFILPGLLLGTPDVAFGVAQVLGALQILAMLTVILRHQLFGIDTLLARTIALSILGGLLVAGYIAIVAAADAAFETSAGPVAAVAVALIALPARDRIDRWTRRLVYGHRDDPHQLIDTVVAAAAAVGPLDEMAERILEKVRVGLALSWVEVISNRPMVRPIRVGDEAGANGGRATGRFDLIYRGRSIGTLHTTARRGEDELSPADHQVIETLCGHLAPILEASWSTSELRQSRDRLVHVREEERRRLRHDLHDGLGPVLTGAAMSIDAARNQTTDRPETASLLGDVREELTGAIGEIRRLVEGLRPPALDNLGLLGALQQHAGRHPQLDITFAGETPAEVSAATEVAVYRIVTEAITNAARHSTARKVHVSFDPTDDLRVEIADDGGPSAPWTPGVGLTSMTERAAEIGGTLTIGPADHGGRVVLTVPTAP